MLIFVIFEVAAASATCGRAADCLGLRRSLFYGEFLVSIGEHHSESQALHDFINFCSGYFCRRRNVSKVSLDELRDAMHEVMREMVPADRAVAGRMLRALYGQTLNQCYDQERNGEFRLIRQLSGHLKEVIDVGANEGVWSSEVRRVCPDARVHAFEPVPEVFTTLEHNLGQRDGLHLNRLGLFDREGFVTMHVLPGDHRLSSIHKKRSGASSRIDCPVTRGDSYVRDMEIATVDLLKVDCEGSEPQVMRGFAETLAQGRISVCQVEYGVENAFNRWLLRDLYDFFKQHGFRVGRLFPEGVAFKSYSYADENFVGGNFVACLAARDDLIQLIRE